MQWRSVRCARELGMMLGWRRLGDQQLWGSLFLHDQYLYSANWAGGVEKDNHKQQYGEAV